MARLPTEPKPAPWRTLHLRDGGSHGRPTFAASAPNLPTCCSKAGHPHPPRNRPTSRYSPAATAAAATSDADMTVAAEMILEAELAASCNDLELRCE